MTVWQERVVTAWLLRLMEEIEGVPNVRYDVEKAGKIYRRYKELLDLFTDALKEAA